MVTRQGSSMAISFPASTGFPIKASECSARPGPIEQACSANPATSQGPQIKRSVPLTLYRKSVLLRKNCVIATWRHNCRAPEWRATYWLLVFRPLKRKGLGRSSGSACHREAIARTILEQCGLKFSSAPTCLCLSTRDLHSANVHPSGSGGISNAARRCAGAGRCRTRLRILTEFTAVEATSPPTQVHGRDE